MLASALALVVYSTFACALWPQPTEFERGDQVLWLDFASLQTVLRCEDVETPLLSSNSEPLKGLFSSSLNTVAQWSGSIFDSVPLISTNKSVNSGKAITESSILQDAVQDALKAIRHSKFIPWKFHSRHSNFEPDPDLPHEYISRLELRVIECPSSEILRPREFFDGDEFYEVIIHNATAIINAQNTIGALRGLQSFQQLFYSHSKSNGHYTNLVPVSLSDRPRFKHRGISIDIARNPFKPWDLTHTIIEAMASAKMNRLHVHATDSQSWPIDIPSMPDLARKGAFHQDLVWTASDLESVQAYGASKGISVFIEIDMPGHTSSVAHAYPSLVAAFNELDWKTFAAGPLSGQLKLDSSAVREFVTQVLEDLLPRNQLYTSLYHIGGDEVNLPTYLLDETVQSKDPEVLKPLLQIFIDHVIDLATKFGLQPIVWEEMLLDWNLTLPSAANGAQSASTLVQVWRNSERIQEVLNRGHRVLFGDYRHWYLDCGFGDMLDPYPSGASPPGVPVNTTGGRPTRMHKPYLDYCSPYHNWRAIYTYNPLENISSEFEHLIEGGEVLMWSEQTDSYDLETKVWPRAAAAAEVLWSGPRKESMLADASMRLGEWRERVVTDLDIRMSPVQNTWCLMEGGCQL